MIVYLIRHGETLGNRASRYIGVTDEPLTKEAETRLSGRKMPEVEQVFSSPLLRCRQTARCLYPDQAQQIVDDLRECDFGKFENKNWKELDGDPDYQAWIDSNATLSFPGGEDPQEFRRRCCRGFDTVLRICLEEKWKSAAIVAHGGTIMSILEAYGIPKKDFYDWHVKNGEGYRLELDETLWNTSGKEIHTITPLQGEQ